MRPWLLLLFALTIACGGSATIEDSTPTEKTIESTGDCPPCTAPDLDGLPPGATQPDSEK